MKFDGMLFCTDLDGTLFNSDSKVSKENIEAIEYFKSEGGKFTFITGRPPQIAKGIYDIIKPNAPIGCFNGAGIYDFEKERFLWTKPLSKEVNRIVGEVYSLMPDIGIQYNTEKAIYFIRDNIAQQWFRDITGAPDIRCNYHDIKENIIKILFVTHEEDKLNEVIDFLHNHPKADDYDYIRSEKRLFEILPRGVSKGLLLEELAKILGIKRENTVAVGDFDNDISMIKAAGIGYAMDNARDNVKAVADRVTVNNNQHAIAEIIRELERDKNN